MGLTAWQRLRYIELPLAAPTILVGIKTAAVINIGTATLGAGRWGQLDLAGELDAGLPDTMPIVRHGWATRRDAPA